MWIDDQVLRECHQQLVYQSWVPSELMVVLGRSNQAELEAEVERCDKDGVAILKRYGGGGTVLLHPGCLVVSVGAWVDSPYQNDLYFRLLNDSIITTIQDQLPVELGQRGYSDIVFGERKIAGTSLFRSRQYLLYQASVLINDRIDEIETYLKHPSKEPDYRKARKHRDFLSCLEEIQSMTHASPVLSAKDWAAHFEKSFFGHLKNKLAPHIKEPMEAHIPHLLKRVSVHAEV
ncbi:MAG: lipoyl protein ligase domain-containing protein [Oligoflexus sp.]